MSRKEKERRVDQSALKVNQAFIITFLVLAFILDSWPLVAFVGLVMVVGTAVPSLALFKRVYRHVLRPAGVIKPNAIADNPEPHRFAQGMGGAFVILATVALLAHQTVVGWGLAWLVVALAALNLFLGFCAGCFLYYQFNKLGVPGFPQGPIAGG